METNQPKGVSYYVKLADGAPFDDRAGAAVAAVLEAEKDTIFNFDPNGKDKDRLINMEEILRMSTGQP